MDLSLIAAFSIDWTWWGHLAQGIIANVEVGGVEIHVGERDVAESPVAERVDPFVEASADPRDLRFGDPRVDTESRDEVVGRLSQRLVIATTPVPRERHVWVSTPIRYCPASWG